MATLPPTAADLAAFWAGSLEPAAFHSIDAWLNEQSPEALEALIGAATPQAGILASLSVVIEATRSEAFRPEAGHRFLQQGVLGSGGMGVVDLMHDRTLNRDIAVKRLRPRAPGETLDSYVTRLRAFKREAALTARLEHPGIVPVHDVGFGSNGEPAFAMKRLEGQPLTALVAQRQAGAPLDPILISSIIIRVAEALGYAHSHKIVHRDIKPDNIVVGRLGAVHVIDWGVAGQMGAAGSGQPAPGGVVGTPQWMAPEQFGSDLIDPRVDVFALGGILMALLTGCPPRPSASSQIDLSPLTARSLPAGLVAVARRCLSVDPQNRYADGEAVASDVQRWLSAGLTLAQEPSWLRWTLATIRRSPALLAIVAMALGAAVLIASLLGWHHHLHEREMHERVQALTMQVSLDDVESLRTAHGELRAILDDLPQADEARALDARFSAALARLSQVRHQEHLSRELEALSMRYRRSGPWPTQREELESVMREAGLLLQSSTEQSDVEVLAHQPLRIQLLRALVELEQARITETHEQASTIPDLLIESGPTPGWRGLGRILSMPLREAHDVTFRATADSQAALAEPATAEQLLAIFGPQPLLVEYARHHLEAAPGDFWSHIICGRAALMLGDTEAALRHALVAIGAEPSSIWPHLIFAYVALLEQDQKRLQAESTFCMTINPDHIECVVLAAVAAARGGHLVEAQHMVDQLNAAHLQFHLQHPSGHPMDRSVQALFDAGIHIQGAPPAIGPILHHVGTVPAQP